MKTKQMVTTALFAALLCLLAPVSVPVGPVPVSLATFAIYLAAGTLGPKQGTTAVLLYILLGAVGLPVFAGWLGGVGVLAGVTGGYIVGYLPCALLCGLVSRRGRAWAYPLGMIAGTAALYAVGTGWFMLQTGNGLAASLSLCVLPFLIGDALKIAAASLLCPTLRAALRGRGA